MREIKFRVWKDNKMDYDFIDDSDYPCSGLHFINSLIDRYNDNYKIMQYTNLKDKNGKEIYEGDIVKFRNDWMDQEDDLGEQFIEVVYWDYNEWRTEHFNKCEGDIVPFEEMEIIGNIYENSKLLKK